MAFIHPDTEPFEHLIKFGYAPGGYWYRCCDCALDIIGGDKRAVRCRLCAQKRYDETPRQLDIFEDML